MRRLALCRKSDLFARPAPHAICTVCYLERRSYALVMRLGIVWESCGGKGNGGKDASGACRRVESGEAFRFFLQMLWL